MNQIFLAGPIRLTLPELVVGLRCIQLFRVEHKWSPAYLSRSPDKQAPWVRWDFTIARAPYGHDNENCVDITDEHPWPEPHRFKVEDILGVPHQPGRVIELYRYTPEASETIDRLISSQPALNALARRGKV